MFIDPICPETGDLIGWITHLKASGTGFSRLQTYQIALKSFFTFVSKMGIIQHNPAQHLMFIRKEKSDLNQPVSEETAFALLDGFDRTTWMGLRDYTLVSMLWALGLRLSECLSLKVGDFDPAYDRSQRIGALRVHGKGSKQRTLFVVDKLYDALTEYLSHPESPQKKSDVLFQNKWHNGKPVSKDRVRRMIKQAAKDAGLTERITPHVLRHTFATQMYERGVPAEAISRIMGHDSIEETSLYIHVSGEMKKEALKKIRIP
ncbi:MAG: tyrosine-type recombinase/integrase [Candidatus Babeliaceae bacterium]|nr:tyrosine-type recombinase/integrase [Candidatus Babeliaceae bacterium]